jgi:hypothetical protein
MLAVGTTAVILVLWSTFSGPLDRRGVTSAMFFLFAGLAVGVSALDLLDVGLESVVAERIAEFALVLLLFSDAMRLDLRALRHEISWPVRLLLVGLPLSLLAGMGAGVLVFPGMALGSVFLLSTMLVATDAALGQKVVTDASVPSRVRQALDVAGSTTGSPCRSSSWRWTSPTPSSRVASPPRCCATPPRRSVGVWWVDWSLASPAVCCSASPSAVAGSAGVGVRSCRSPRR